MNDENEYRSGNLHLSNIKKHVPFFKAVEPSRRSLAGLKVYYEIVLFHSTVLFKQEYEQMQEFCFISAESGVRLLALQFSEVFLHIRCSKIAL